MAATAPRRRVRPSTATSAFGVSRRESHDATGFYQRFQPPHLSADDRVAGPVELDESCLLGDARHMAVLPDASVALVVTSPPYFAGKTYEAELGRDGVPGSYLEYLELLRSVFAECVRVLEPGGRMAINVANLGRKPFRNLAADVTTILQDDLGLLLRGEVIWQKAKGATGSCAWGSFRSPANPVLRDVTERVILASKGRFDRALSAKQRAERGLPSVATVSVDEFLSATLDVWSIDAESATRIGHPAPFPVALPRRLIELLTYEGDLVLDPFMGSGTTIVAAVEAGRRGVGYDLDPAYVELACQRVSAAVPTPFPGAGEAFRDLAISALAAAGFTTTEPARRTSAAAADLEVFDRAGHPWAVLVAGTSTSNRVGLEHTSTVIETAGRAAVLRGRGASQVLVVCPRLPAPRSEAAGILRQLSGVLTDVADLSDASRARLAAHAQSVNPQTWFTEHGRS